MRGNRSKNTRPEVALEHALQAAGIRSFQKGDGSLPGTPDFSFPLNKVAIFLHGCFWHRCPYCKPNFPDSNKDYWSAKFKHNIRRDKKTRAKLKSASWRTLVIWECVLRKDQAGVIRRIKRALGAIKSSADESEIAIDKGKA
jgi:DNA mismatch endonuclease (patch repair protein)